MKGFTAMLLAAMSSHALADVYTCEINQHTVYSDTPCQNINKDIRLAQSEDSNLKWWEGTSGYNRYKKPILLNGPLDSRVDTVSSIINEAWTKSNLCKTAISTNNIGSECKDFTQFIEPGTYFWQASHQFQALTLYTQGKIKDQKNLEKMKEQIHTLIEFRSYLHQYIKEQQLAQR